MTEQQEKAIKVLNRLFYLSDNSKIEEEEYFMLMDFIVNAPTDKNNFVQPYQPFTSPQPLDPYYDSDKNYEPYGKFGHVTAIDNEERRASIFEDLPLL